MKQARHRLRRLRLHRPPDLRVPARVQRRVHRRRPRQGAHRRGPGQGARHRHGGARDRRGRARRRAADRAVPGRQRRLQHRRPVRPVRWRGRRGLHHRRLPLPGHHRRAGLADHLRREVRRSGWRKRACCWRRASPRCTPPGRSPPSSAWRSRASTRSTSWSSGRARRPSPRPGRSWSTRACPRRTTWSRTSTRNGPPTPACTTWWCPASTRPAWPCRGAAPRTRCGSSATRGWPTSRCWAACSTARSCWACRRS